MAYGFQVRNSSGLLITDSLTDKQASAIVSGTVTIGANGTTSSITCLGMTTTNQSAIDVLMYDGEMGGTGLTFTVTRSSGSFTITNPFASSKTVQYVALRY